MYSIVPFIIKVITISSYNTCIFSINFYINTAAIPVAINLNIFCTATKSVATIFLQSTGCVKSRGQAKLAPAQKFAQHTHHTLGVHAKRWMESGHTHADAHTWMERLRARPLTKPSHQRTTIVTARDDQGKAEKLQLFSRPMGRKGLQVPMHLSYKSDRLSDNCSV